MSRPPEELLDLGELRDSARRLLTDSRERATSAGELWQTIASLGWLGIGVTQVRGGLDQPFSALAVLYEELGRVLAPHAFIASSVCLHSLAGVVEERTAADGLLHRAMRGEVILADLTAAGASVQVHGGLLQGIVFNVFDADRATHLVLRVDHEGPQIIGVPMPHAAIAIVCRAAWDESRVVADVHFNGVDVQDTLTFAAGSAALAAASAMAAHRDLAMACDALGGAEAVFAATLQYLQTRQQFNRPIASFQAIKHRCADLAASLAGARALTVAAGRQFTEQEGDWRSAASACRLYGGSVYREVSEEAIQLHGGIGFTWEHHCHRHLKRSRCSDVLGGLPDQRRDAIAPALFRGARH